MSQYTADGIKVRTISCFVTLDHDTSKWKGILEPVISFAIKLQNTLMTTTGYEIQSLRLVLNPFSEYLDMLSEDSAVQSALLLKKTIDEIPLPEGSTIRCAIGAASLDIKPSLICKLIDSCGDLASICFNVPADKYGIPIAKYCDTAARVVKGLSVSTKNGEGNFQFTCNFNCPPGIPYFPSGYSTREYAEQNLGAGACSFAIGLQYTALLKNVLEKTLRAKDVVLQDRNAKWDIAAKAMIDAVEKHTFRISKLCEAASQASIKSSDETSFTYVGIDTSPAPNKDTVSYCDLYQQLDVPYFGAAGSVEASAFLTRVFKSIRSSPTTSTSTANSSNIGFSGLMLAPLEDFGLVKGAALHQFDITTLLTCSAVCGIGLDTVPIPEQTSNKQISALMRDIGTMAFRLNKPLTVRLFPCSGVKAGEMSTFDNEFICNCTAFKVP